MASKIGQAVLASALQTVRPASVPSSWQKCASQALGTQSDCGVTSRHFVTQKDCMVGLATFGRERVSVVAPSAVSCSLFASPHQLAIVPPAEPQPCASHTSSSYPPQAPAAAASATRAPAGAESAQTCAYSLPPGPATDRRDTACTGGSNSSYGYYCGVAGAARGPHYCTAHALRRQLPPSTGATATQPAVPILHGHGHPYPSPPQPPAHRPTALSSPTTALRAAARSSATSWPLNSGRPAASHAFTTCAAAASAVGLEPSTSAAGASSAGVTAADASAASAGGAATASGASVDPREAAKFAALAASWWRTLDGPFAPLHALNPARVRFIRQSLAAAMGLDAGAPEPLAGLRVLDVGCGGGILSEALARLGATVHGIDITRENVEAARLHARTDPRVAARVRYDVISAEDLAASGTAMYDVVVASEVLEHVSRPHKLLPVLASLLAPPLEGPDGASGIGGALVVSTLNRTPAAWAVAIAGAEYVVRVVPAGTHQWRKFITPEELAVMADACGLQVWHAAGMAPVGPRLAWQLTDDLAINYIATLRRR